MLTMEPDMVLTPLVTGAGLPPVGGGPGGREGRVRVRLLELTLSFTTEFLEIICLYLLYIFMLSSEKGINARKLFHHTRQTWSLVWMS